LRVRGGEGLLQEETPGMRMVIGVIMTYTFVMTIKKGYSLVRQVEVALGIVVVVVSNL